MMATGTTLTGLGIEGDISGRDFAIFLGCTIPIKNHEFEKASRYVLGELEIGLEEMKGAGCCPNPVAIQSLDIETWMALAARNIIIAQEMGLDIVTLCAGCFETLRTVDTMMKEGGKHVDRVNQILGKAGYEYKGSINVHHFVGLLSSKEMLKKIKERVTIKLDLKVSSHYGCHLMRPSSHMHFDDPERPETIDKILGTIGLKTLDSAEKMTCCGYCARLHPEIGQELSTRKMIEVKDLGVDCVAAACPACSNQFMNSQRVYNRDAKANGEELLQVPILYVTELLALSFGLPPGELRLASRKIKPTRILEQL